jgi:Zn-finger nucleic acid-binding protein
LQIDCPRCSTTMTKEWQANVEFFSCSKCHIYAIGRDES